MNKALLGTLNCEKGHVDDNSPSPFSACGSQSGTYRPFLDSPSGLFIQHDLTSQNQAECNDVMRRAGYPSVGVLPHGSIPQHSSSQVDAVFDLECGDEMDAWLLQPEYNSALDFNHVSGEPDFAVFGMIRPDQYVQCEGSGALAAADSNNSPTEKSTDAPGGTTSPQDTFSIQAPDSTYSLSASVPATTRTESPSLHRQWSSDSSIVPSRKTPSPQVIGRPPGTPSTLSTFFSLESDQMDHCVDRSASQVLGSGSSPYSTPLHHAVANAHVSTVRELILHGADVSAVDQEGRTALHICARNQQPNILLIVQLLTEAGALLEVRDGHNLTPLQVAAERGNDQTVRLLLALGADVNSGSSSKIRRKLERS